VLEIAGADDLAGAPHRKLTCDVVGRATAHTRGVRIKSLRGTRARRIDVLDCVIHDGPLSVALAEKEMRSIALR